MSFIAQSQNIRTRNNAFWSIETDVYLFDMIIFSINRRSTAAWMMTWWGDRRPSSYRSSGRRRNLRKTRSSRYRVRGIKGGNDGRREGFTVGKDDAGDRAPEIRLSWTLQCRSPAGSPAWRGENGCRLRSSPWAAARREREREWQGTRKA